ncbi:MAG: hypothetical protein MZV63_22135 [Marinilabiliales bacterium]|nr:hypothetical protein [Marinilabiliales bacterium]
MRTSSRVWRFFSGNRHDRFGLADAALHRRLRPGTRLSAPLAGDRPDGLRAFPSIVTELRKHGSKSEQSVPAGNREVPPGAHPDRGRVSGVLPVLGFSAGLALITAGGMRLMGRHGWVSCVVTVFVTAVCIHYLFGQWLAHPLYRRG